MASGVYHKIWAVLGVEVWYNQCAWSMKVLQTKFWVVSGVRPAIVPILAKLDSIGSCLCLGFFMHHNLIFLELVEDTSLYTNVHLVNHGHPNPINVVGEPVALNHGPPGTSPLLRIQPFQDQKLAIELPWLQGDFCWGGTNGSVVSDGQGWLKWLQE